MNDCMQYGCFTHVTYACEEKYIWVSHGQGWRLEAVTKRNAHHALENLGSLDTV